jgi:ferredoxin-NADP reductase
VATAVVLPVLDVAVETPRTRLVRLVLGGRAFPFLAGQAVDLASAGGPDRKPYSIACSPEQSRECDCLQFLIQVREDGRAGPHLPALGPGTPVEVGPPLGGFVVPDHQTNADILFVAGGTGIAPIRSMLWHVLETSPAKVPRLLYSARGHREFAFGRELRALADAGRIRLRETITRSPGGGWYGYRGRIARAASARNGSSPKAGASRLSPPSVMRLPGGASRLAALLFPRIFPIFSVVAPCQPGAALRNPLHTWRGQATSRLA